MLKFIFLATILISIGLASVSAQQGIDTPDLTTVTDAKSWTVSHATAEALEVEGKPAVRLTAAADSATGVVGLALPLGFGFATGTIEVDLKGKNLRQRSFLGVAFNVVDEKTFEGIYFRPFNFNAEEPMRSRAVQYISWPENTWERLRTRTPREYENSVSPVPGAEDWFHATIEVTDKQVRVYVNRASLASLVITRLAHGGERRPVGLFVDTAEGLYANFKINPAPR